ncbi:uncharacterized protein METZ01_LOCUS500675, partial [marine metagenome]
RMTRRFLNRCDTRFQERLLCQNREQGRSTSALLTI